MFFRMPQILVYVTWNQNFQWALVRLCRKESSTNISCFRKSAERLHDLTISDFAICTQQIMEKISNRSMKNVWSLLKVSYKDTRTTFLWLTLNKFHTSFGGLKWWYGSYLCKFFWLKLYSQYLLRCIYYVLFTKILQGGDTASGAVPHKKCCRTCGQNPS